MVRAGNDDKEDGQAEAATMRRMVGAGDDDEED